MQTSNKPPVRRGAARREQDLIVVPDARPRRRWGLIAAVTAAVLVALLIGVVIGVAIQRSEVRDLRTQLAGSADQRDVAVTDVGAALARVESLESRIADLRAQMELQDRGVGVLRGRNHEQRRQLRQTHRELREAHRDLDAARSDLRAVTGPPLGDGTFMARVMAVGATQSPARIVVDVGSWFTGTAATGAAAQDGVVAPTDRQGKPWYFRNVEPAWRIMPLNPSATVTFYRWGPGGGASSLSAVDFQHLVRSDAPWAARVAHDPFWVTVQNGTVTAMQEQRYP